MRFAFLCDFDGTVSPDDICAAFVRRFSSTGAEPPELLARWKRGELGHRALTQSECRLLVVERDQALAFTRQFQLDPTFPSFVRAALAQGDHVMVVSEGFGFYVGAQLDRAGLGVLPWAANHLRFEDGRVTPEFPHADPACPGCGNCKAQHVRRYAALGCVTVMVGDGLSDRCGARVSDHVVARGTLLEWCRREGIQANPFGDFADVTRWAEAQRRESPSPRVGARP